MDLKHNARIFAADASEVGHLDRVVVNPVTQEISYLVVRQGLLFAEHKLVPIGYVDQTTEDDITLRPTTGDLRALPPFEEPRESLVEESLARSSTTLRADLAPGLAGMLEGHSPPAGHRLLARNEQNIPEGTVAVKGGARIITADGRHAGTLECIAFAPNTWQMTHLQIAKGLLHRETRLIPSAWVVILGEDEVHLSVDQKTLEAVGPHPI